MTRDLRKNNVSIALETGLEELTAALSGSAQEASDKNELSNEIIEEEGQ
jgi:hypothetical protein